MGLLSKIRSVLYGSAKVLSDVIDKYGIQTIIRFNLPINVNKTIGIRRNSYRI